MWYNVSHPKVQLRHSARAGRVLRDCATDEVTGTGLVSLMNVLLGETRRVLRWRPQRHAHFRAMLLCYRVIACYATALALERERAEGCSQLRRLATGKVNVLQTVSTQHALALRASARARACCHQHYAPAPDAASRSRAARCRTRCSAATSCAVCICALCQRAERPRGALDVVAAQHVAWTRLRPRRPLASARTIARETAASGKASRVSAPRKFGQPFSTL